MDRKDAYRKKLEAQIDEWSATLQELRAKAKGVEADAKIELDQRFGELSTRLEGLKGTLRELERAGASAWDSLKQQVEHTKSEFVQALDRTGKSVEPTTTGRH